MAGAKRTARLGNYQKRGFEFGNGGMPMAPPPGAPMGPPGQPMPPPPGMGTPQGNPADMLKQKLAAVPKKQQGKIKKALKQTLQQAMKAKQGAGGAPMPPPMPAPAGGPPMMRKGGKVKKAIGGAVRGVGIARKGGGRGKIC